MSPEVIKKKFESDNFMNNKQPKILLLIITLFWFTQYIHIPFQTVYLSTLNISSQMIGIIIGVYGIAQLALRIPVGISADRNGNHKLFIIIGMLAAFLGALFRVMMPNGIGFFIANLLSGIASAMWISFMVLYTNFFSKDEQRIATTRAILANAIGLLLAFISSTVLYHALGMVYINALGIITGMIGLSFALTLEKVEPKLDILPVSALLSVLKNKKLILFSGLALVKFGVQIATVMSFTSHILRDLEAGNIWIGGSTIIFMVSSVIFARIASTKSFVSRFSRKLLIPTIFGALTIYCILIPNSVFIWQIFILQTLPGLASGVLIALLTAEAMSEIPLEKKSTAMGCFQAIYAIGMTLFPAISGALAQIWSMKYAFYFLAATCFIATLIVISYYKSVARSYH